MPIERGPKSLHEHNKSLLYSNRPKFKEDIRENIYVDKVRNDGLMFEKVNEEELIKVIAQIKLNSKKKLFTELKILSLSVFITVVFLLYLQYYLDLKFS